MSKSVNPLPSQANLRRLFRHNRSTGRLVWRFRPEMPPCWNARFAGAIAGRKNGRAGITIAIYVAFYAHRIVWKMVHGTEPLLIDHKSRDRSNNRLKNLRIATKSGNGANTPSRVRDLPRGVFRCSNSVRNPYRAQIHSTHLGVFPTKQAAARAFLLAARQRYGEFAYA